jgi:hypothetical protein
MKPRKGIRRAVSKKSRIRGWYATIRRASGNTSRLFSDGVYGGRLEAYRAASKWYEDILPSYPLKTRLAKMSKKRSNNRSGIPGVYRWPASGKNIPGAYWGAQWVNEPNDRPNRRKYSIATYGETSAKKKAIAVRKKAILALLTI